MVKETVKLRCLRITWRLAGAGVLCADAICTLPANALSIANNISIVALTAIDGGWTDSRLIRLFISRLTSVTTNVSVRVAQYIQYGPHATYNYRNVARSLVMYELITKQVTFSNCSITT